MIVGYTMNNVVSLKEILNEYFESSNKKIDDIIKKVFTPFPAFYWPITRKDVIKIVNISKSVNNGLESYPTIIDIGCGTGAIDYLIYREDGGINVIGFDPITHDIWNTYKEGRLGFVKKTVKEIPYHFYPEKKKVLDEFIESIYKKTKSLGKDWTLKELNELRKYYNEQIKEIHDDSEEKINVAILSWPPEGVVSTMYIPLINPKVVVIAGPPEHVGINVKPLHRRGLVQKNIETLYNTFSTLGVYEVITARRTSSFVSVIRKIGYDIEGPESQIVLVMSKPKYAKLVKDEIKKNSDLEKYPWDGYSSDGIY